MRRSVETTRTKAPAEAGVTLLELMVSVVLVAIVLFAAMAAFLGQNRAHQSQALIRQARDSGRDALAVIERNVALAGYGMGPEFAFEVDGTAANPALALVDNDDAPDELVFLARSTRYYARLEPDATGTVPTTMGDAWMVQGAAGNTVTLLSNEPPDGSPAGVLAQDQVLLLVCPQGFSYTYVTVADEVDLPANGGDGFDVTVTAHDNNHPFHQTNALTAPCFSGGQARAFAIDRYRFFIDDEGDRPYLFLDRGVPGQRRLPVAADIEDLQVAYITRDGTEWGGPASAPASDLDTGDLSLTACPQAREITWPFYEARAIAPCALNAGRRDAPHVGNIGQVRVTIVARTPRPIREDGGAESIDPLHVPSAHSIENRDRSAEADDGFRRVRLSTTVELHSMRTRGIPSI